MADNNEIELKNVFLNLVYYKKFLISFLLVLFSVVFLYFKFLYHPMYLGTVDIEFDKFSLLNRDSFHTMISSNEFKNHLINKFGYQLDYYLATEYFSLNDNIRNSYKVKIQSDSTKLIEVFFKEIKKLVLQKLNFSYPVTIESEKMKKLEKINGMEFNINRLRAEMTDLNNEKIYIKTKLEQFRKKLFEAANLEISLNNLDQHVAEIVFYFLVQEVYVHYQDHLSWLIREKQTEINDLNREKFEQIEISRGLRLATMGELRIIKKKYYEYRFYIITLSMSLFVYIGVILFIKI